MNKFSLLKIGAVGLSFCIAFFSCIGVYSLMTEDDVSLMLKTSNSGEFISFTADGKSYVIDVSTGKYSYMQEALMSVKEFGKAEVDTLVLTHYHLHHQNSIYRLSDKIKIRNVLLPYPQNEAEQDIFTEIKQMLESAGVEYTLYTRGGKYTCGSVSMDFSPLYKLPRSAKPVIALKINAGKASFTYIESAAFEGTRDYGKYLGSEIVFVGAHGPNRKFRVPANAMSLAKYVIFTEASKPFFRETDTLANVIYIGGNDESLKILYDN